ncbi:exosortase B [Aquabacterium sp. OR-4]|uniref:exosortase B n=1 Tax=Aquabacterium sp. OR-4 TaxID=2978127 RepID=UPI0021B19E76|nr:exosortase B [Aquabacterium sp. OR-4]MDT7835877.1 exosortase B [Aquabacterium sp. OR-4]
MTKAVNSVSAAPAATPGKLPLLPVNFDWLVFAFLAGGFALLYLPAYYELANSVWATDEQGHGPIILVVSFWLLYQQRHALAEAQAAPMAWLGWPMLLGSLLVYTFGRSQDITLLSVASQIGVLMALALIFKGARALRLIWFPLFFMIFMVPLPEALVSAVTGPLKSAVSAVASTLLYQIGYPVGRSGVVMTVGPYQLLVADACAGLNSMFTLEALGMLYMNLMRYTNPTRNVALALLLVPTAFVANIVRVMILVLVTYHFGDEAGQGFVHSFAGMVLFMVALVLMLGLDKALGMFLPAHRGAR